MEGQANFLGPDPDFEIVAVDDFECDKTITFNNLSSSETDQIIDYRWSFGEGADQEFATGEGPHDIVYASFGEKVAVLTVESSRGCIVTKVLDLVVEPCCDDLATLELNATVQDLTCFESGDGIVTAEVTNGSPEYLYSLDGNALRPNAIFNGLDAGSYEISVIDIKGCEDRQNVQVNQPEEIQLFLNGPQDTVDLGQGSQLFSDFSPMDRVLIYTWSPTDGLSCTDCPDPLVVPPGTTTYTLTVEDQDGCITSESIVVFTTSNKPFLAPNIISLNPQTGNNGVFKVTSNEALDQILEISVFDRWGNELYKEENFHTDDDFYQGWEGVVRPSLRKVNPGVYVWVARVRFIDGDVRTFAGDITVVD